MKGVSDAECRRAALLAEESYRREFDAEAVPPEEDQLLAEHQVRLSGVWLGGWDALFGGLVGGWGRQRGGVVGRSKGAQKRQRRECFASSRRRHLIQSLHYSVCM